MTSILSISSSKAAIAPWTRCRHAALAMTVMICASSVQAVAQTAAPSQGVPAAPQTQAPSPATNSAPPVSVQPSPATQVPQAALQDQQAPAATAPFPATEAPAQPSGAQTPPAAQPGPSSEALSPVEVSADERSDIPHNLSAWGMFMAADWVVKSVMIGLALASLATWTVWLAKSIELAAARVRAGSTLKIVHKAKTLAEATEAVENKGGPAALMLRMATHEMTLSDAVVAHTDGGGIKERVSSILSRIETHAGRRMSRGTGVLASIGSVSPFVGLFGTVWGIMNAFIGISESQTTNLAVVAPGIAEALLATAIGLVAAIPAVVIYNVFARSITGYRHLLADVAAGVERLVSRDLDFRRIPPGSASKPQVSLVGR
ncbi:tonB-system energizer ExbB [uncultured Agrobacterium sp.]|uniref:tonB-system energizer ExbB n=1 Tax=uncultured Agrobacterium sp. TaxID=157277 RepID=UPI0025E9D58E|nr:tonB-system energizer ExbB [uncultured Agrobacterium sp.]